MPSIAALMFFLASSAVFSDDMSGHADIIDGEVLVSRLGAAVADDDFKGVTTVFGQCLSLKFPRIIDRHPPAASRGML
jgi:hypothetical protein